VTTSPRVPVGFGPALYRMRMARRWSLRRAAGEAGVSVTTVMRAERGCSVQLASVVGLASAYGATVGALLDGACEDVFDPLPAGALTAAQDARYGEEIDTYTWDRVAKAVLLAAAPLIRADERKRAAC